ncbi:hypothetical protein GCM10028773_16710 [Spirosoma koreense]
MLGLGNDQVKVSAFQYDLQGRLGSIVAYLIPDSSQGPVERNTYQYDAQNRLVLHQRTITRPSFYRGTTEQHKITYNANGQVEAIKYYNDSDSPGTPILTYTALPQFTAQNKLQNYQKQLSPTFLTGSGVVRRDDLTLSNIVFTGDNLTAFHRQRTTNDIGSFISTVDSDDSFTYDDQLNPFYGLYFIPEPLGYIIDIRQQLPTNQIYYYGGLDNWLNLSRNNILTYTTSNAPSVTTYQYNYNAAHLPISRTISTSNTILERITYQYESY